ncbi:MAG: OmpP1/FadL family transporter [Planctomycetota bacterium]|jgi:long-chain fatty acid transport protein
MLRLAAFAFSVLGLAAYAMPQGGAIALYEVGTPDMGMSAAGATARAEDAGTVFWNPAGMTRIEGHELSAGFALLIAQQKLDLDFDNTVPPTPGETDEGGNFGGVAPVGGTYFLYSASEDLKFGLALNGLWGGNVDYNADWIDRLYSTEGSLGGLNIQPTIGIRVNDWFSIGAGLNIVYAKLELELRGGTGLGAPTIKVRDADDWGYGGSFGLMFEPRESTRIGVVYRTGVDLHLDGDVKTPLPTTVNFESDFSFAQGVNVGLYQDLNDEWALLADAGWSDWSEFSDWGITAGPTAVDLDRNWKDTWRGALGLQWRPVEDWTFRTGVSYDSNPIRAKKRLPDIPVGEAWRFSLGTEHAFSESTIIGATYTFLYGGNASYDSAPQPPDGSVVVDGRHEKNYVHFIGLTARFKF